MQKIENIMETNQFETETIKKSSLTAEDTFDYLKITAKVQGLLPCTFEESTEEVTFSYDCNEMTQLKEIKQEPEEQKLQFLVNFAKMYDVYKQYYIELDERNIFYDENFLPHMKSRDIWGREHKPDAAEFLYAYKCIAGGILSKKYKINQVLDSGLEILRKEKSLQGLIESESIIELVEWLKKRKIDFLNRKKESIREVSKKKYLFWRTTAVIMLVAGLACGGLSVYYGAYLIPEQKALIMANERYITKDYVGCIDSVKKVEIERMDVHTKYILAVSYASTESFKQEEISNITSRLSANSNEKELEYWICLGRLDVRQAENLALTLSDDKLLIYAYMKEIDLLENDTNMDGEEKKARLDTLNNEIKSLGEKYKTEEQ